MSTSNRLLTVPSAGLYRFSNMFGGNGTFASKNPSTTSGMSNSTAQWKNDVTWWGHGGDICATSASSGVYSSGNNGANHWQNIEIGTTQGHYLSGHITGFKFKASQDSGAGHGMYIRRVGFMLIQKNGTGAYFCDSLGVLSRGSYGTKTYDVNFTSTQLSKLQNSGYCFHKLAYQVSTEGGTGTRTTSVRAYDFQFKYIGSSGKHLLIPMRRPYANRKEDNRFAD
jgi:hypothetical protein